MLSLDAPLVAVAWLYVFAKAWRVEFIPWFAPVALGLAVWTIYVGDRLLDVSLHGPDSPLARERHRFHWRHRTAFRVAAGLAAVATLVLVTRFPSKVFLGGSEDPVRAVMQGYLFIALVLLGGFVGLSMLTNREDRSVTYAKNILAGCTFAFGTAMTVHVFIPMEGPGGLLFSREVLCFAALCALDISAVDVWEHAAASRDPDVRAADELSLTIPLTLLGAAALGFAYLDHEMSTRPFYYAILTGTAFLYVLNRNRELFRPETLRVLADAALLAPALVFLAV